MTPATQPWDGPPLFTTRSLQIDGALAHAAGDQKFAGLAQAEVAFEHGGERADVEQHQQHGHQFAAVVDHRRRQVQADRRIRGRRDQITFFAAVDEFGGVGHALT